MNVKKTGKSLLCKLLENQAKKLINKSDIKIICVGGSVGKTSTKLAIAKTLASWTSVIYQDGNYNDRLTVPLVLFNKTEPNIFNPIAWARIIVSNQRAIKNPYPYKFAVLEIGTDGPGQLKDFAYLQPDLYVLSAIAEEHMQFFDSLASVAEEELIPTKFSKQTLVNLDTVNHKYLKDLDFSSYGTSDSADYRVKRDGEELNIRLKNEARPLIVKTKLLGVQGAMVLLAAASVSHIFGHSDQEITRALEQIEPSPGRMQLLPGLNDSLIIDDTYNASPLAVKAAFDVLYGLKASKRIAILGSMNELGIFSAKDHEAIGKYCDPKKLILVVTIGAEAKQYLGPAAKSRGCQVVSFMNPSEAGDYVKDLLEPRSAVLVKGSQNGVFSEEAVKQILNNPQDASKLVRQSKYWLNVKSKQLKI